MNKPALLFSLTYLFLGVLWIYFSQVFFVPPSSGVLSSLLTISNLIAFAFFATTSVLLYIVIRRSSLQSAANKKLYQKLFENSPGSMWIYEEATLRFLAVNETAIQKYGYSRDEFLKLTLENIRPQEEIQKLHHSIKKRKNENYNEDGPFLHRKKNGDLFYVQVNSKPTTYLGKKARLVVAVDINEKIRAEEKSRKANKELSSYRLAISSASFVFATDPEGKIRWANGNFCRLSQYSRQELIGKNIEELSNGYHQPALFREMFSSLLQGINWRGELRHTGKEGQTYWLDNNFIPIPDKQGRINRFISISTDITDKKRVQEELVQREKLLSSVVNSQNSFLVRINKDNHLTYANERFLAEFQSEKYETDKPDFKSALHPDDIKLFESAKKACCQIPGKIVNAELRLIHPEKLLTWTSWEFICVGNEIDCTDEIQGMGQDISIQKTAELELEKYAKRLDRVLDSIDKVFYTLDRHWNFKKINKEFEQVYGISRSEATGKNILDIFPDLQGTSFYCSLQKAMKEGTPLTFEEENTKPGNWFQVSVFPVKEGISCYSTDISRKKEAEEQIRQAVERFNLLTKATFDTTWEWDLHTDALQWNEGIATHFKYDNKSAISNAKLWEEKIHTEDYDRVVSSLFKAIEEKQLHWQEEYRVLCGNGNYRYIIDRGYVIYDEQRKPLRMIGAIQDIHQQREFQEEIKKLSLVAEKTQNAVVISDKYGRIEWVNDGFTRLTGWPADEVISLPPSRFLHGPATDALTLENIEQNLVKRQNFSEELILYKKSKQPFWVRVDISPIFDEKGEIVKFISIGTDITERMQFEHRLRNQNEQLKEIAWISSHDIRRPVASILGLISLYDQENAAEPFNREIINLLHVSTRELDKVIRKIVYKTYEVDEMEEDATIRQDLKRKDTIAGEEVPDNETHFHFPQIRETSTQDDER